MRMYKVVSCLVIGVVFLLLGTSYIHASLQKTYTIDCNDIESGVTYDYGSHEGEEAPEVFLGDGAEYRFRVINGGGGTKYKWGITPAGGICDVTLGEKVSDSSLKWQAPVQGSTYKVDVEIFKSGDGEGEGTLKGKWDDALKTPIVDTYWEKVGGNRSTSEVYVAAPEDPEGTEYPTKAAYVFVGYAEGEQENALEGIATDWTVDEEKEGITDANKGKFQDGAQWVTEIRKRTVASGEASVTFRTSRKAGDWHKAKATVYDKPEDENDTKQLVKGDPSPKITVLKVDLGMDIDDDSDIDSDDDDAEESPGGIVLLNWDDDDDNDECDMDQTGQVSGENDLRELKPKIEPTLNTGTLKLEATAGGSRIEVWQNSNKSGTHYTLPITWNLETDTVPASLWIEGVQKSGAARDVELKLSYTDSNSNPVGDDKVKVTVVDLKLGNAVYRKKTWSGPGINYNHAGMLENYLGSRIKVLLDGKANYDVCDMQGDGMRRTDLDNFATEITPYYGEYTTSTTYTKRLQVLKTLAELKAQEPVYCLNDAVEWDDQDQNGKIDNLSDITALRCDGLVEVCYEANNAMVWGRVEGETTYYDIMDYPEKHNDMPDATQDPETELSPKAQRGAYDNTNTYFDDDTLYQPEL